MQTVFGCRRRTNGEFACRAGTTTKYACGDDDQQLRAYAVFGVTRTEVCGSLLCNAWGLFDMHGNVWEWCWNLEEGSLRVYRGGSWSNLAGYCRSSYRYGYIPSLRSNYHLGFRVAQSPSAGQASSGGESGSR